MAHTSDSDARAGRVDVQAGSTARRRMGRETGERGGAGQRDQGNTKESRGHTQGAREQQGARAQKKNNGRMGGHTGRAQRGGRVREVGGTGGQRGRKRNTMSLTEKHHAVDPHGAVPAAPPDHQGTDGGAAGGRGRRGVPPKGCLGRPPRSAYRSEDRAQALRHVRAREIQPWRGDDQRRAHGAGEQH